MYIRDEIARRKLELLREDVREGVSYTKPWLDLDVEAYRSYRERETSILPNPYCDDVVDRIMMENVQGMSVLCLAGGGGQQSAVFSLLVLLCHLAVDPLIERIRKFAVMTGGKITNTLGD